MAEPENVGCEEEKDEIKEMAAKLQENKQLILKKRVKLSEIERAIFNMTIKLYDETIKTIDERIAMLDEQIKLLKSISKLCELKAMLLNEEKKKSMAEDTRRAKESGNLEDIFLQRLKKMEMAR
jgi:glutaminase